MKDWNLMLYFTKERVISAHSQMNASSKARDDIIGAL